MQTIHAMFAIGLEPTGSKDPFALRRSANGVIKILAESNLTLKLSFIETEAARGASRLPAVTAFLKERLEFYLRDVRGFRYDIVNAVLATDADDVRDAIARAEALTAMRESEDLLAVSAGFKRIKNILRQAEEKNIARHGRVEENRLIEPEERALFAAMQQLAPEVEAFEAQQKYREALESIARLRPGIDAFFNKVMVMAPEETVRRNRLALIAQVLESFSHIGDVSEVIIA
jgi:glycyl-tRNA synthetase beta chain